MAQSLKNSRTKENLMKAFAGESQARNRYTFGAELARRQGLYAVEKIFLFTAEQERAHAERFYELLKEMTGETIEIQGTYPIDDNEQILGALKAAQHNEFEEADDVYQAFWRDCKGRRIFRGCFCVLSDCRGRKTSREKICQSGKTFGGWFLFSGGKRRKMDVSELWAYPLRKTSSGNLSVVQA